MTKIAVYGSLKAGKYNNYLLSGCELVEKIKVKGTLYRVSSYPALVEVGGNEYEAEVYEVPDDVLRVVRNMELGAGYKEVMVGDSIVYYADSDLAEYCEKYKEVIDEY